MGYYIGYNGILNIYSVLCLEKIIQKYRNYLFIIDFLLILVIQTTKPCTNNIIFSAVLFGNYPLR